MVWILAVIGMMLIGFLIKLWRSHRRYRDRIKASRQRVHQSIERQRQAIAEVRKKTEVTRAKIEDLEKEKSELAHEVSGQKDRWTELEERAKRTGLTRHPLVSEEDRQTDA